MSFDLFSEPFHTLVKRPILLYTQNRDCEYTLSQWGKCQRKLDMADVRNKIGSGRDQMYALQALSCYRYNQDTKQNDRDATTMAVCAGKQRRDDPGCAHKDPHAPIPCGGGNCEKKMIRVAGSATQARNINIQTRASGTGKACPTGTDPMLRWPCKLEDCKSCEMSEWVDVPTNDRVCTPIANGCGVGKAVAKTRRMISRGESGGQTCESRYGKKAPDEQQLVDCFKPCSKCPTGEQKGASGGCVCQGRLSRAEGVEARQPALVDNIKHPGTYKNPKTGMPESHARSSDETCKPRPKDCRGAWFGRGRTGVMFECKPGGPTCGSKTYTITQQAEQIDGVSGENCKDAECRDPTNCKNGERVRAVDCEGAWGAWSACSAGSDKKTRTYKITRAAANGGSRCPFTDGKMQEEVCRDCAVNWDAEFGACDKTTGTQTKGYTVARQARAGGAACPAKETKNCNVDCEGKWENSGSCDTATGKQPQTYTVTQRKWHGGSACAHAAGAQRKEQDCPVPCEGRWGNWTSCDDGAEKKTRTYEITRPAKGGGSACAHAGGDVEEKDCNCAGDTPLQRNGACRALLPATTTLNHSSWTRNSNKKCTGNNKTSVPNIQNEANCKTACQNDTACAAVSFRYASRRGCTGGSYRRGWRRRQCSWNYSQNACTSANHRCKWSDGSPSSCEKYTTCTTQSSNGWHTNTKKSITVPEETLVTPNKESGVEGARRATGSTDILLNGQLSTPTAVGVVRIRADLKNNNRGSRSPNKICVTGKLGTVEQFKKCVEKTGRATAFSAQTQTFALSEAKTIDSAEITHEGDSWNTARWAKNIKFTLEQPTDCEVQWNSAFGACDKATGTQTKGYTVVTPAAGGGAACPAKETKNCDVDCEGKWGEWAACDLAKGEQTRTYSTDVPAKHGGAACAHADGAEQKQNCDVDCKGAWENTGTCNAETGLQTRTYKVSQRKRHGGSACATADNATEEQDCPVPCEGSWGEWTSCADGAEKKTRAYSITREAKNGGAACARADGATEEGLCSCAAATPLKRNGVCRALLPETTTLNHSSWKRDYHKKCTDSNKTSVPNISSEAACKTACQNDTACVAASFKAGRGRCSGGSYYKWRRRRNCSWSSSQSRCQRAHSQCTWTPAANSCEKYTSCEGETTVHYWYRNTKQSTTTPGETLVTPNATTMEYAARSEVNKDNNDTLLVNGQLAEPARIGSIQMQSALETRGSRPKLRTSKICAVGKLNGQQVFEKCLTQEKRPWRTDRSGTVQNTFELTPPTLADAVEVRHSFDGTALSAYSRATNTTVDIQSPDLPVNCKGAWGTWGACSNGKQSRTYTVTQEPLRGGTACPTVREEEQNCIAYTCKGQMNGKPHAEHDQHCTRAKLTRYGGTFDKTSCHRRWYCYWGPTCKPKNKYVSFRECKQKTTQSACTSDTRCTWIQ